MLTFWPVEAWKDSAKGDSLDTTLVGVGNEKKVEPVRPTSNKGESTRAAATYSVQMNKSMPISPPEKSSGFHPDKG